MRALFLQSPIAAVAAVCISVPAGAPIANAAAPNAHQAGVAVARSAKASDISGVRSNLKLVLASTGTVPRVGAGVADASAPKFEILALPNSVAASVAAGGASGLPHTLTQACPA